MDKSFINIDDLVKQRLVGGEEESRSGAWSNMRDLLDKEMPKTVPGGAFNWRRMMSYTVAMLLIASASVGGYEMATAYKAHTPTANDVAASSAPTALVHNNTSAKLLADNSVRTENATDNNTATNTSTSNTNNIPQDNNENNKPAGNNTDAAATVAAASKHAIDNTTSTNTNSVTSSTDKTHDKKAYTAGSLNKTNTIGQKHDKIIANKQDENALAANDKIANTVKDANKTAKNNHKAVHNTSANNHIATTNTAATKTSAKRTVSKNTKPVNADNVYSGAVASHTPKHDDIVIGTKLEIRKHYIKNNDGNNDYRLDTISMTNLVQQFNALVNNSDERKMAMNTPSEPASKNAKQPVTTPPVPQAATNDPKTEESAKDNTSAAKHLTWAGKQLENMSAAFNDIKYHVNAIQFAPGLTAGINGTFFGPNNFKGFQFGVTGNFLINKQWSVMGELKYVHRINNNLSISDNYDKYTLQQSTGLYEKDSTLRSFAFSTLHSFEFPVTVHYSHGKLNFFAGPNFVYSLSINTGGGDLPYASPGAPKMVAAPNTANSEPKLTATDFNARFGIGYIFGISYEVAPNFTIDFRNVQTVWDNAKTPGERAVSHELYKSPSLQLSLGYRLGSKD